MKSIATRVLAAAELTDRELFGLCSEGPAFVQSLARRAYTALSDLDSAQTQLEDARYWVTSAMQEVDRFLDDGRSTLNSLGVLQAKGAALDVAVVNMLSAEKAANNALQVLAEGVAALS